MGAPGVKWMSSQPSKSAPSPAGRVLAGQGRLEHMRTPEGSGSSVEATGEAPLAGSPGTGGLA